MKRYVRKLRPTTESELRLFMLESRGKHVLSILVRMKKRQETRSYTQVVEGAR